MEGEGQYNNNNNNRHASNPAECIWPATAANNDRCGI